ncbi:hypothetical protein LEP1GSC047_2885 [Leptospira inadai serovar Lyme str. 10]|uniref:Uncharacterized protein n=1 Tax=Leptospira inadai serovar Lyme str. 10 TaxID=1049790 RepID=V6HAT1_9LEPT|nr:hypothetical protein LEP1GSC047_2885 [Leptospira inadai serovar Lyme str. 10]
MSQSIHSPNITKLIFIPIKISPCLIFKIFEREDKKSAFWVQEN